MAGCAVRVVVRVLLSIALTVTAGLPAQALAVSEGHYADGRLRWGVPMPEEGPDHYLVLRTACYDRPPLAAHYDDDMRKNNFYGHASVVSAVREVAANLRASYPRAGRLAIGEISNRRGGKIPFHLSHQNGLDVDIPYARRRPIPSCTDGPSYEFFDGKKWRVHHTFDHELNWALVSRFAERRDVRVIFIGGLVKSSLLAWAKTNVAKRERRRVAKKLVATFCRAPKGVVMGTYRNNRCPHDDHIHVRFACPPDSPKCRTRRRQSSRSGTGQDS